MQECFLYQQIKQAINQSQRPMIVSHVKPDGDTVGSAMALYFFLKGLGKQPFLFCRDKTDNQFDFIKETSSYASSTDEAVKHNPDFIFFADCADLKMAGLENARAVFPKAKLINIDHHSSNPRYGDVNLIVPSASSACEVVFNFFKMSGMDINDKIATMLFLGIFTDTNNFSNAATSPAALFAAAELWRHGIFISEIKNNLLKNKTISFLKLWGLALGRIKHNEGLNLAATYVTKEDLSVFNLGSDTLDGLSNFLNANLKTETIAVLKELGDGTVRVSLRTTSDEFDLSRLARVFGGGGHKKASGFSVKGSIKKNKDSWSLLTD